MHKETYLEPKAVIMSMVTEATFICASGGGDNLMITPETDINDWIFNMPQI